MLGRWMRIAVISTGMGWKRFSYRAVGVLSDTLIMSVLSVAMPLNGLSSGPGSSPPLAFPNSCGSRFG